MRITVAYCQRWLAAFVVGAVSALISAGCQTHPDPQTAVAGASASSAVKGDDMNTNFSFTDISVREIESYRGKARFIDVREPDEFTGELGHIAGAELVPLATVSGTASSWKPEEPLVIICRSGGRSSRAAQALVQAGFTKVMNMAGGMLAYQAAGLPAER